MKIRKGDMVKVIAGKDKGKTGKVLKVLSDENRLLIERINLIKRHQKPTQTHRQGGIIEKEATIAVSNVMYYDDKAGKTSRIGAKFVDGKKMRVAKRTKEIIQVAK